jgi:hypothetical protein
VLPVKSLLAVRSGRKGTNWAVEYAVERSPHMETIQIVLEKTLLRAADKAARQK